MAPKTKFLTNDNLTRKRWAKELFMAVLKSIEFNNLIGTGADSIVQSRTELGKGEGDQITFGIRLPLSGEGIVGYNTVEGNEEKLQFKNYNMTIEELNHAVDTGGKMEEQRVPYDLMKEGKDALNYWWGDKLSDLLFATLCGDTTFTIAGGTFAQAQQDPDTYHWLRVNDQTSDANITSADIIDLAFLDRMKQRAEIPTGANPWKVRPVVVNGKKMYRVILHNYQFDQLRRNMNAGEYGDMLRDAQKLKDDSVEFVYNGMMVSKSERIRSSGTITNGAGCYRAVLLGAQAACVAWGGAGETKSTTMSFVPYLKDAKRYTMIRGGGILGIKKVRFNSEDYGVIVGSGYGAPLG